MMSEKLLFRPNTVILNIKSYYLGFLILWPSFKNILTKYKKNRVWTLEEKLYDFISRTDKETILIRKT